jgi:two-component system, NtrC family, response regulator AtoC
MESAAILVVDDEEAVRTYLTDLLSSAGYQARTASAGPQALEMLAQGSFDAVILDVLMPEMSGLEVLERYRAAGGRAPVLVLSALSGADDAVRAMKVGATDYLSKPFENRELEEALARALGREGPARPPPPRKLEPPPEEGEEREARQLISSSSAMHKAKELIERIADTDVPVLLLGESGTGKEVIAREIHARSRRRAQPFIKVNCAALPAELLESELFGHERGAFTGATAEKPGKFELADRGTIFLDEIGEMAIRLQAKLLQVLQDEDFYRVGGKRPVRVDARVVVATNRNLDAAMRQGTFREDLFYRLNVVTIRVPPLRERKEEIEPLVRHFVSKYRTRYQGGLEEVPPELIQRFYAYDWPGNVRELENLVRRLVVLRDPAMVLGELTIAPRAPLASGSNTVANAVKAGTLHAALPEDAPLKDVARRAARIAEREAILRALVRTGWNKRKAAKRLQISYKALLYKIKDCGIVDPRDAAMTE